MRDFQFPGRSPVLAQNGMCATSHPLAAQTALRILQDGGNAADAAIGAGVLLGLCEPQMTGLGGDCFALIAPPDGPVVAVNGSGRAPAGLDVDGLRSRGATVATQGIDAVTVPGAVDAFCTISDRYGRLGLADTLAPAIRYAEEGVPVAPRTASDWVRSASQLTGRARDHFLLAGRAPEVGQIFRAPGQAEVLRRIAAQGRAGFYEGDVADDMVAALQGAGGSHDLDDFAGTGCDTGTPVSTACGKVEVLEHPPNGQGATALLMLNILKHFDLASLDPLSAERAHLEAEAAKLAYDARDRFIADPGHTTRLEHMLAPETAARLAALIRRDAVLPQSLPGAEAVHRDTVYLTVVDRDRMAVSLIYSLYWGFGSGLASDRFGILFQNRGAGFTLERGHANEAGPGKRPMHTIIPGMLRQDGRVSGTFGVMGGSYQPAGHTRLVTNMECWGLDPQAAIDLPRSFPEGGTLQIERGYPTEVVVELATLGHKVEAAESPLGGAQAILIGADGVLTAGSDPRKDGCAIGY